MHVVLVKYDRRLEWYMKKGDKIVNRGSVSFDASVPWNHPRSCHKARSKILLQLSTEGMKTFEETTP